jgi:hypothetical protein
MPHERMRSLRWGWELLQALQADSSIPLVLAARAETLAQTYPTPQTLILMLQADRPQLLKGFGESVDCARALFDEVQFESIAIQRGGGTPCHVVAFPSKRHCRWRSKGRMAR